MITAHTLTHRFRTASRKSPDLFDRAYSLFIVYMRIQKAGAKPVYLFAICTLYTYISFRSHISHSVFAKNKRVYICACVVAVAWRWMYSICESHTVLRSLNIAEARCDDVVTGGYKGGTYLSSEFRVSPKTCRLDSETHRERAPRKKYM